MEKITSLQNKKVKEWCLLHKKKFRDETHTFLIEGEHLIEEALKESILKIVDIVKGTLEKTPPELASDIMEKGIVLAGGGALIKNLDKLLSIETGMPVYIADEPLYCVVRGAGKTLDDLERLKTVLINSRKRR